MKDTVDLLKIGNEKIFHQLNHLSKNSKLAAFNLAGSYIFTGATGSGKEAAAWRWSQSLLCPANRDGEPCGQCPSCKQIAAKQHSCVNIVRRDEDARQLSIESIRDLLSVLRLSVGSGDYRIGIVADASHLSEGAANALLKTLEEPAQRTVVILLADDLSALPKTIVSRSRLFRWRSANFLELREYLLNQGFDRFLAHQAIAWSGGRPLLAWRWLNDETYRLEQLAKLEFFNQALDWPVHRRLEALDKAKLAGSGQEALAVIACWRMLVRDWLLAAIGAEDLSFWHKVFGVKSLTLPRLQSILRRLQAAEIQLRCNVGFKTVLENILINS